MTEAATVPTAVRGDEIRIGVSSCLLGQEVRYDGGHKRDGFITGTLAKVFRFVAVCPEVEIGLGTPREPIRLVRECGKIRLISQSGTDLTDTMSRYAEAKVTHLAKLGLAGYVLKSASPSCGMERVRVHEVDPTCDPCSGTPESDHPPRSDGRGIFARVLTDRLPLLPVEEEGRLHDPRMRESFFNRVFGYHRLRRLFSGSWTVGDLVAFHGAEKYVLLSHDPEAYAELGRLVARSKGADRGELRHHYETRYMSALSAAATTEKHVNVLLQMTGYLRERLSDPERREIADSIEDYRRELVPRIIPVTLIRNAVRAHAIEHLRDQRYLEPLPRQLTTRSHA